MGFLNRERREPAAPHVESLNRRSELNDQIRLPDVRKSDVSQPPQGGAYIPRGYNPEESIVVPLQPKDPFALDSPVPPEPPESSQRPTARPQRNTGRGPDADMSVGPPLPARGASTDAGVAAVLAAAGLTNVTVTPEMAGHLGQIFRIVVQGVMDVLESRRDTKRELDLEETRFGRELNNPLKFSTGVDDALHNLLVKRSPGYLNAVDAFGDAFDDLREHQVATIAGLRAVVEAMLAEFAPDHLEKRFDRPKFRYWDQYRERYDEMVKDVGATLRRLFREEFARAYEAQLKQLKDSRGNKP
jgi:type VI secretion system FHA domain protein